MSAPLQLFGLTHCALSSTGNWLKDAGSQVTRYRIAFLSSAPPLLPPCALLGLAILAQAFLSQQRLETVTQSVCKTCTMSSRPGSIHCPPGRLNLSTVGCLAKCSLQLGTRGRHGVVNFSGNGQILHRPVGVFGCFPPSAMVLPPPHDCARPVNISRHSQILHCPVGVLGSLLPSAMVCPPPLDCA